MDSKSNQILSKNRCRQISVKMAVRRTGGTRITRFSEPGGMRAGAKGYQFKRFPSEENKQKEN
jgi:hypothetical protein